ncbi:Oligopeptide/dipeptide uptake family ABC transporter, ATP-binding protein [Salipiger mucosus DSM 16094]|uniref:Oligopeptide/dipeptide uptake family ABC transporter, ATP-binding protein n=1 Tax=Salipiger mucosus DSM 16094 TaxID=1123237 RepID=S9SH09_9RHOB|nr:Oligopeptide/dipeptide uptake family ABC transporter, ATP-binding protein [Salipiger mucosus DSM 16094]
MSALLEVKDLAVTFTQDGRDTRAVKGVSFDIQPGETVALVGESGSGKSVTALSTVSLLGDAAKVEGSVLYKGQEMIGAPGQRLRNVRGNDISFIFQEPMTSLNPLHTLEKQLLESLALHQGLVGDKARARILDLLERVGIRDAENRLTAYPHQLSGGQRQRVMIAMALANGPDLLIADEPTTALDVTIQAQILDLLMRLKEDEDMSLLFITHDLNIVRRFADRVCVMKDGEIVEAGRTTELFDAPQHAYTRMLLSAESTGKPDPVRAEADEIARADNLRIWFPIQRGLLKRTVGHVKAVNDASFSVRAGETVGIVGESGSGKTTLALAMMRLIQSEGGIVYRGRDVRKWSTRELRRLRSEMQIVFQDPFGSLSPRHDLRADHRRGAGRARLTRRQAAPAGSRGDHARGRARSRDHAPLPARILGRPAPAHRHRTGHGAAAPAGGAGRADLGAGHDGAGADRRPAARSAAAARPRLPLHQPRPEGGARDEPRGHRDEPGRRGRDGPRRRGLRRAKDRLHPQALRRGLRLRRLSAPILFRRRLSGQDFSDEESWAQIAELWPATESS